MSREKAIAFSNASAYAPITAIAIAARDIHESHVAYNFLRVVMTRDPQP
jgi:hypothetical protein